MSASRIALLGSGSLAGATAYALAQAAGPRPIEVRLFARNERACRRVCRVASALTALAGDAGRVTFSFECVNALDTPTLARAFAEYRPDVVLVMASEYSPYEKAQEPTAWTGLLRRAPFGVTLPLQAVVALSAAEALERSEAPAPLVNGCYPDAVNPLLRALHYRPLAGVGNVSTLAAGLVDGEAAGTIRAVGHHWHLDQPPAAADEALVWLEEEPFAAAAEMLWQHRQVPRRKLNALAGQCAASLVRAWIDAGEFAGSLPGPHGLPGGYPVRLSDRRLELDMPACMSCDAAVAWNRFYAERDGVTVDGGAVRYSDESSEQLRAAGFPYADGFMVDDVRDAAQEMGALRSRLSAQGRVREAIGV